MRAVVYPAPKRYAVQDVPEPAAGPGQAAVKVMSTTVCATDFKVFDGLWPVKRFPHVPGHEGSGRVVAVGSGITPVRRGDRVEAEIHIGCGGCRPCLQGLYTVCESYGDPATGHAPIGFSVDGSLAQGCAVPARGLESMGSDRVGVKPLLTHHVPLEAFGKARETFPTHEGDALRVMLHPRP